jgi:photosystem II stability/assembly factor-like uncharacterized protein
MSGVFLNILVGATDVQRLRVRPFRERILVVAAVLLAMSSLILSSAMADENWTALDKVTNVNLLRLCFLDSLTGWVVGDSGTILKTTDAGKHWVFQDSQTHKQIVSVFFADQNHGWTLASVFPDTSSSDFGTIVLHTTDGGGTWAGTFHPDDIFLTTFFFDSLRGWMGGWFGKIVGTTNGGTTWFPATIDSANIGVFPVRRIRFFSDSFGLAVGGSNELVGIVWTTTNGGASWKPQLAGSDPIHDVHFFDSLNILGISGGFDDGTSMVRTTDGGQEWAYEYIGIWGLPEGLSFRTQNEGWAPLAFAGTMMRTTDAGQTWEELPVPDHTPLHDVTFLDSLSGYMVGNSGTILKYSGNIISVKEDLALPLPGSALLYQNYPNPFNPTTSFRYAIPQQSRVILKVYDLLGQEVISLVDERRDPGIFEASWNGRNSQDLPVAAGIYIVRLAVTAVEGKRETFSVRKIALIR